MIKTYNKKNTLLAELEEMEELDDVKRFYLKALIKTAPGVFGEPITDTKKTKGPKDKLI